MGEYVIVSVVLLVDDGVMMMMMMMVLWSVIDEYVGVPRERYCRPSGGHLMEPKAGPGVSH